MTKAAKNPIKFPPEKQVAIGSLHPDPNNPRQMPEHEAEALAGAMDEFGVVERVVARPEDGLIIGGHQRIDQIRGLLRSKGMTEEQIDAYKIPVVMVDGLSDAAARKLNLALNRIHGEWDYSMLPEMLEEVRAEFPDMTNTGFTETEIDDIMRLAKMEPPGPPETSVDPDEEHRRDQRRFRFEVENDEVATQCWATLKAFGLTGPGDAGRAFVAAMAAAAREAKP